MKVVRGVEGTKIPQLSEEDRVKEDYKIIQDFIKKPEAQEQGLIFAKQINREFKSWFTLNEFTRKFKADETQATSSLQMLSLLNLIASKKNKLGQALFKITLTKEARVSFLKTRLKELEIEGEIIRREINKLEKK
jgi:hypothetical protein